MKHLYEVKNYEDFLSNNVMIAQKLDGTNLNAKFIDGEIRWYGREGRGELDVVKRTISNLYEDAIYYLEPKLREIFTENDQEFSFEYFPDQINPIIPVVIKPKNNLFLLYTNNINDSLSNLSEKLNVSCQPIIFEGLLTDIQKEYILSRNFTQETIKILNPDFNLVINSDLMEGLILKGFKETYKMTNRYFTEEILNKKKEFKNNIKLKKYNNLLIQILVNFSFKIPEDYKFSGINFMNVVFDNIEKNQNNLIEKYNHKFVEFDYGEMFRVGFSDFVWRNVPNSIQMNMKRYYWFKDLVRMILVHYGKIRKTKFSGVDEDVFNKYINIVKIFLSSKGNLNGVNKSNEYCFR